MPSIEAPAHYERAKFTLPDNCDQLLRWLDNMEFEAETGHSDSPIGWVGLLKLTWEQIDTFCASAATADWPVGIEPGWYIVREDGNGILWGIGYGEDCTFNEEAARADFAEAELVYDEWLED